jgi:mannose-6-phosphate isomerase-like protein (cupin superfamily)
VLDVGEYLSRRDQQSFHGLEVARFLGKERSTIYKSLHRLEALGLLVREGQAGRRCYRFTEFGRESLFHARLGRRVFGRQDARPEVKLRRVRARAARARELAALMDAYERGEGEIMADEFTAQFTARRVVTGHDADGRAVVVSDGEPPNAIRANGFGVATWLWLDGPPATVEDGGDELDGPVRLEPPPGGCSVRIIRFPGTAEGGGDWIRVEGDDPDEPGMHATDTLDFMVVIEGRIALGLDDGEHELGAGDVVIQRGNRHRWRVVSPEPCTYVVCMLRPDPGAAAPVEPQQSATAAAGTGSRRLVAATDEDGRSYVLADGPPPASLDAGETRLVELWQTGGALSAPDQGGDPEGAWELEPRGGPGNGGICFRTVRHPAGFDPGDAGWHTTATIDVDIVLSGRLELSLPDQEPVVLGPGEAVVQRGTHHRWRPVGDEPVEWAALMLALT